MSKKKIKRLDRLEESNRKRVLNVCARIIATVLKSSEQFKRMPSPEPEKVKLWEDILACAIADDLYIRMQGFVESSIKKATFD